MSNYTVATDFGAKDALVSGDGNKLIEGAELTTEYDAIAVAIATKHNANVVATLAIKGILELATVAEINTGTDVNRGISPDGLAGSVHGTKIITLLVFPSADDVTTGDGKLFYHVPASLNGMDIITVHALNHVAGITGQCDVQIHNVTDAVDILSTVLSVDTTEVGSDTADTPAVINTSTDGLATNDILRIDVDAIHSGTAPKGLSITIECRLQ